MNPMLDLCLLSLETSERQIKQRAAQLFMSWPRAIIYLGDRRHEWQDIGIELHPFDWTDTNLSFKGATGIVLDFESVIELWELVHTPVGSELSYAIETGTPCLAIGGGAELLGNHLMDSKAMPSLEVIENAIDATHRLPEDIQAWQQKFPIDVCSIGRGGEWIIKNDRQYSKGVNRMKPGQY
jgi:hypothetical protein